MSGPLPIEAFLERYAVRFHRWTESMQVGATTDTESRARRERALPWIDASGLTPDPALARTVLFEILDDVRVSAGSNRHVLDRLDAAVRSDEIAADELLRALFHRDAPAVDLLSERIGVPTQVLHFIGIFFARPFLSSAARGLEPGLAEIESARATCPACGAEPALALLMQDDGQRRLWCRCCATEWTVRRLRCLSCGNTESGTLGYFYIGEETGRRVDYCERCKSYIRTIDLRATGLERSAMSADREDLSNDDLDAAAAREGFIPLTAENELAEWRRAGMGNDRKRGG